MLDNVKLIAQSAIRIENKLKKIIYFDPFKLNEENHDADYIFITHPHYDHFSEEDINKIKNNKTKIIAIKDLKDKIIKLDFIEENIILVEPNENYIVDDIKFTTTPAYNLNKEYHKMEYNWVGYVLVIDGLKIYVAGDTDNILEIQKIKCDVAFVPVGGTYTMTSDEAASLIKEIKPKLAIPIHYKTVVGTVNDAYKFKELLNDLVDVKILVK